MDVIAECNDPVRLSFLLALLRDAGLRPVLYDGNMAATFGLAAMRQRIAVPDEQAAQARRILRESGYDD